MHISRMTWTANLVYAPGYAMPPQFVPLSTSTGERKDEDCVRLRGRTRRTCRQNASSRYSPSCSCKTRPRNRDRSARDSAHNPGHPSSRATHLYSIQSARPAHTSAEGTRTLELGHIERSVRARIKVILVELRRDSVPHGAVRAVGVVRVVIKPVKVRRSGAVHKLLLLAGVVVRPG